MIETENRLAEISVTATGEGEYADSEVVWSGYDMTFRPAENPGRYAMPNYLKGGIEIALLMSGEWEVTLVALESSAGAGEPRAARRPLDTITAVGPDIEAAMEIAAGKLRGAMANAWPPGD